MVVLSWRLAFFRSLFNDSVRRFHDATLAAPEGMP
jgi:hypothetical protein